MTTIMENHSIEISIFLARFWGVLLTIESLIYFFRWRVMLDRLRESYFITLDGYLSFTLGIATVVLHNVWVADWRITITIWGYLMLLRGITRLGWPDSVAQIIPAFTKRMLWVRLALICLFIFGAWLIWVSW